MKLFDAQSGAQVEVPDQDATEAIASGKYGLPAGSAISLRTDDGIKQVPIEQASRHLADGATVASPAEVRKAELDAKYGGVLGGAEALGEGALAGASLYGSDMAVGAFGDDALKQRFQDVKEAHPYLRGGGELAGAILPALASEGTSTELSAAGAARTGVALADAAEGAGAVGGLVRGAGRALAAPTELASGVGSVFERGVGALVGDEATSLGGKIAQGAAKAAGRGVAEGALYGGAQELGEQSLGPAPLNGSKVLAAVGHGALLGGLAGGALGAGTEAGAGLLDSLTPKLRATAEERAAKSVISGSGQARSVRDMERVPGGVKAVGRELLDRDLVRAGDTVDDIAERVSAERTKVGEQLGQMLQQADASGAKGVNVHHVISDLMDKELPKLSEFPSLNKGGIDRIQSLLEDIHGNSVDGHLGFEQAQRLRRRLDGDIKWAARSETLNVTQDALKSVRGALESEIERAGDEASKTMGKDWLAEYKATKSSYRKLAVADDAAGRAVTSRQANRVISPSDYGAGALGGGLLGVLHGSSPLGMVGGLATSIAHHYVRERGASTAAAMLDKITQLGAVRRAAMAVDARISGGVKRAVGTTGGKAAAAERDPVGGYQEKRNLVASAASSPQMHRDVIESAAQPIATHAPATAAAFKSASIKAVAYLAKQMPAHPPLKSLLPQKEADYEPSPDEQAAFVRKFDAVDDPPSILDRAHEGALTQDEVDAVQAVHPELLEQMRNELTSELGNLKPDEPVPQGTKESLSTLLGQPVDGTVSPPFVQAMQAAYAPPPGPMGPKPGRKSGGEGAPKRELKTAGLSSLSTPYGSK